MSEWIGLHDNEWTPEKLSAEIANRSLAREVEFGPLEINVPPFSSQGIKTQRKGGRPYTADLSHHLSALNEIPNFEMIPIFEESPATRNLWIGGIWGRVRKHFHNLVLFYINRASQQQSLVNNELIAALNELIPVIEGNQEEAQSATSNLSEQNDQREGE
jgi:hypothetical protein